MIVISGALVLVALVLLVVGVVGPDLAFVYASIAVSLVSLVFLVVGILQRRGDPLTDAEGVDTPEPGIEDDPAEGLTVRPSSVRRAAPVVADDVEPLAADVAPAADPFDSEPPPGGDVLVVEGRPRYHVVGCRYLSGKTPEAVAVGQARVEGFTPCGVCKPDVALAALEPGTEEREPARRTSTRSVARTRPAKAAAPVRSASLRGGSVVVIPDRGRYHLDSCRYVRDVVSAQVLSKSAATRQGYVPCGVCKP